MNIKLIKILNLNPPEKFVVLTKRRQLIILYLYNLDKFL